MKHYVHGYTEEETKRLYDQAETLREIFHAETAYPKGSRVLEVGCGVGAQTIAIAERSRGALITSLEVSAGSIAKAKPFVASRGIKNVDFVRADLFHLPFHEKTFDHLFVCFVLEHLKDPVDALIRLKKSLKPGGSITVIEGDHGSWFFHPESKEAMKVCGALIESQIKLGGDPYIGRKLYPLVKEAGFVDVAVNPLFIYSDGSKPEMIDGFVRKTIIAMVESVREKSISEGLLSREEWKKGIAGLEKTALEDGSFCYTFFRATARNK